MTRIAIIGTGYVGLTTGACMAHLGHDVICADIDPVKVERLSRGEIPIVEAGLDKLVADGLRSGKLSFVLGAEAAASNCEIAFLCVPTPQGGDDRADLSFIQTAARQLASVLPSESIVINKSTVPVGSTKVVERELQRGDVSVVSNPEFLREGSAVHDFLHPDRIVIGAEDQAAAIRVASLYLGIAAPLIVTDPASAETIKYAANAFLATKISFINAVAAVCEAVGADVQDVILGVGYDKRIGQEFLRPGPGWGGSCFVGSETVLAQHGAEPMRLVTFAELDEIVARVGADRWQVLSWDSGDVRPSMREVSVFTKRPYDGDLVTVHTKMGRRVTVTADHPMVTRRDGVEMVVSAGELTNEDWLPVALEHPLPELGPRRFNLLDGLELADIDPASVHCRLGPRGLIHQRELDHRLPAARRHEARRSGTMSLTDARTAGLDVSDATFSTVTNGTYVPCEFESTELMWQVIGLYLAGGHISRDGRRERISWSFHPRAEGDLIAQVEGFLRMYGIKPAVRDMGTSRAVIVSSRILAAWFRDVMRLGTNSYDKRIPDVAWSLETWQQRMLLRGLWDGDGSWSLVAGGPSVVLEYGTVSRQLADGMVRMLAMHGVMARVRVGRANKSTVDTYWLVISGADNIERSLFLLPEHEQQLVQGHLGRQSKRITPTGYKVYDKGTAWVRVTDVVREHASTDVYSLEVPGTHTVVTSFGLVAHNCFPKDTRALVRIAEDHGYDFDLLKGVIEVNELQLSRMVDKIEQAAGGSLIGKTVAAWGLTFKARTDDLRESPALSIIERVVARGATVRAFDPTVSQPLPNMETVTDPYDACDGADVLAVLTEWDDFRWLDLEQVTARMSGRAVVDTRNLLDRNALQRLGFTYQGVGR